jgi:ankyrin repeat protein
VVVRLLVIHGVDINAELEEAVLGEAAEQGREATVLLLLDSGANIGGRDDRGRTALHLTVMNDHYAAVQRLVERGQLSQRRLNLEELQNTGQRRTAITRGSGTKE